MDIAIIKDETKWLLEAINEQYDAIHRYGGKIPQIEFDILMENVRKFYENMHRLQRLNESHLFPEQTIKAIETMHGKSMAVPESPGITKPQRPEPVQPEIKPTTGVNVRLSENLPDATPSKTPAETSLSPGKPAPVQFRPVGLDSVRQDSSNSPKKTAKSQEPELFAPEEPAFSIKLKAARDRTLGPKIQSERIENLKTAISINEKFMFINELFDGNLREYNETIETLNGFKILDQAAEYLDLMRKKNFWNTGSTAFKKLSELVERRF